MNETRCLVRARKVYIKMQKKVTCNVIEVIELALNCVLAQYIER